MKIKAEVREREFTLTLTEGEMFALVAALDEVASMDKAQLQLHDGITVAWDDRPWRVHDELIGRRVSRC